MKTCPNCKEEFGRRNKGGLCPNCGIKLKLVREDTKGVKAIKYVMENQEGLGFTNEELQTEVETPTPRLVMLRPRSNVKIVDDEFHITHIGGTVLCPACEEVLITSVTDVRGNIRKTCLCGATSKIKWDYQIRL